jgi:SAM-dependent methyltransferase
VDYEREYLLQNPTWHVEDSSWKAAQICRALNENGIAPSTVGEIGCGAGTVLRGLHDAIPDARFVGYDVSPTAIELARRLETDRLVFKCTDLFADDARFDVLLAIDVFEHVEDYLGFLRKLRSHAAVGVFHIPLDISVSAVLRPGRIIATRKRVGHLHYFTKETALATLEYVGYRIISWRFTPGALELPNRRVATRIANVPRRVLGAFSEDLAARMLGGYSILAVTSAG